jgi:thiol-disulfide isomerase/thioredoxin
VRGRATFLAIVASGVSACLLLSACAHGVVAAPDLASHVDVDTAALRAMKHRAGVAACPRPAGGGSDLPVLTLPCLGGGRSVRLSDVSGPAVISLWASWCVSCPHELPLYQRLSEATAGKLSVLGVDYQDTQPGKALALLQTTHAVFPQVADPGGDLADHYRLSGLPGILLVDGDGKVTFLLRRLERYADLVTLVEQHTGVTVGAG